MENSLNKGTENSMEKSLHEEMDNGMEKEYKYDAFISYRHVEPDQTIAKEIHNRLRNFIKTGTGRAFVYFETERSLRQRT